MINLLRASYTASHARLFLVYQIGMSRHSLCGSLSMSPLVTITQGVQP